MKYWFGELPQGWSAIKLKHLTQLRQEEATDKANYIGLENIEPGTLCICGKLRNSTEGGAIRFSKSDVLFNKLRPYLKKVWVAQFEGCASKEILVMRPLKINSTYLSFVLLSPGFIELVNGSTYGAKMPRADWSFIGNQWIPVPPPRIQKDIAKRLREYLLKINILILENHEKLSHLAEYRQSLITQAVTKGLDPNAEMKESGIEWIGEIPRRWEIKSLKRVIKKIGDVDHFMPKDVENGIPYVMTGDLKSVASMINFDSCKKIGISDYKKLSKKIKPEIGDVILARYATIGTTCFVDEDRKFIPSYSCVIIKPNASVVGKYLHYYIQSHLFQEEARLLERSNTQGNLGIENIKQIRLPIPKIDEQKRIVDYLEDQENKQSILLKRLSTQIDLLKEYRSSLITAAVTGKLNIEEATYGE